MNDTARRQPGTAVTLIAAARSPVPFTPVPASLSVTVTPTLLGQVSSAVRAAASLATRGLQVHGLDVIAPTRWPGPRSAPPRSRHAAGA